MKKVRHRIVSYVMVCAIWYHLYHLKNVKNTRGGGLFLVKLQAEAFSSKGTFTNGNKSCKASHIAYETNFAES